MPWNSIDPWNAQRHIEMAFRMVNVESDMKFIISARKTLRKIGDFWRKGNLIGW